MCLMGLVKGDAYAIVAGNSHTVANGSAVQRDEDGVCGSGGRGSSEGETGGELHVGLELLEDWCWCLLGCRPGI
jgi:hypothetical protein